MVGGVPSSAHGEGNLQAHATLRNTISNNFQPGGGGGGNNTNTNITMNSSMSSMSSTRVIPKTFSMNSTVESIKVGSTIVKRSALQQANYDNTEAPVLQSALNQVAAAVNSAYSAYPAGSATSFVRRARNGGGGGGGFISNNNNEEEEEDEDGDAEMTLAVSRGAQPADPPPQPISNAPPLSRGTTTGKLRSTSSRGSTKPPPASVGGFMATTHSHGHALLNNQEVPALIRKRPVIRTSVAASVTSISKQTNNPKV